MWLQKQSSVWYGALLPSPVRRNRYSTNTSPPASPAKDSRQVVLGGTHHPASNAWQIPSQLGLRQEERIFSPTLPLSLTFLPSIRLDKGTTGTSSSEDIYRPELCSETRWIYWAEPLKENFNCIVRNFSPYGCPVSTAQRDKPRQSLGEAVCWEPPYCTSTLQQLTSILIPEKNQQMCLLLKIPTNAYGHGEHQAETAL